MENVIWGFIYTAQVVSVILLAIVIRAIIKGE